MRVRMSHMRTILLTIALIGAGLLIGFISRMGFRVLLIPATFLAAALLFRYPECALALMLSSGYFKAGIAHTVNFMDITAFLGAILAVRIIVDSFRGLNYAPIGRLWPYGLVLMFTLVSVFYAPNQSLAVAKAARFVAVTTLGVFAAAVFLRREQALRRFLLTLLALGSLMAVVAIATKTRTVFGSNYLALGRSAGMAALVAFYFAQQDSFAGAKLRTSGTAIRLLMVLLTVLCLLAAILSAGRGPIMMLPPAIVVTGLLSRTRKRRTGLLGKIAIAALIGAGLYLLLRTSGVTATFAVRARQILRGFSQGTFGSSGDTRLLFWHTAVQRIAENPITGVGFGNFTAADPRFSGIVYPHNIFLEVGSELGLPALISFVTLMVLSFLGVLSCVSDTGSEGCRHLYAAILALLVFTLLNAMVSGDLNDNRHLLSLCAAALMCRGNPTDGKKAYCSVAAGDGAESTYH